jgi:hypothetical protein
MPIRWTLRPEKRLTGRDSIRGSFNWDNTLPDMVLPGNEMTRLDGMKREDVMRDSSFNGSRLFV